MRNPSFKLGQPASAQKDVVYDFFMNDFFGLALQTVF